MNDNNNNVSLSVVYVHQQNLAHRILSHDAIMAWLHQQKESWILCLQEPYIGRKGISKLPPGYGAFWSEKVVYGNNKPRAALIAPKCLKGYMVIQYSNADCVIVRFEKLKVTIVSLYCSIEIGMEKCMESVTKECEVSKKVIIGADLNAYHRMWGSVFGKTLQYRGIRRGIEMMEIIEEYDLEVVDITPHLPTFVRHEVGKRKGIQSSHIDVTLCTSAALGCIREWKVVDEVFFADHRCIRYQLSYGSWGRIEKKEESAVKWKKPSTKMELKMRKVLVEKVTYKRRMDNVIEVEKFIEKHSNQVKETLEKIFCRDKEMENVCEIYWWSAEVKEAHKKLVKKESINLKINLVNKS